MKKIKFNKSIAIGIPTFLRDSSLFRLLNSNAKYLPEFKMYILDQGKTTPEKEERYNVLKKLGHVVKYIPFDSGISKSRRILKKMCKEEFLVFMQDDFESTEKTDLYKLKEILDEFPSIDIVGGNLEGRATTGAYSYFFNRADDKMIYFPVDYLVQKKLVDWEKTSSNCRFVRADIVSDFTMWRKSVPNIFDDNVKTIEHSHVYLRIKFDTKCDVAFCPDVEIKHNHDTKSSAYNPFRARVADIDYLKKYWNVTEFYTFNKSKLYEIEKLPKIITEVPLKTITKIEEEPKILIPDISREVISDLENELINLIKILDEYDYNYCLIENTCTEIMCKKEIKTQPIAINVFNMNDKLLKILEENKYTKTDKEIKINNITFCIKNSGIKTTKAIKYKNIELKVPCPVVHYLEKFNNKSWSNLKNGL